MLKRIIAGVLSVAICASAFISTDLVELASIKAGTNADSRVEQTDYEIQSTNKLGDYIAGMANQQNAAPCGNDTCGHADEDVDEAANFFISNLEYDAKTGKILLESTQTAACRAVISFLDDETSEVVTKTEVSLAKGKEIVSRANADRAKLPAYYLIRAELVDTLGNPLCAAFYLNTYGKDMQEILAADIHDFDEDQVVQFTESEDTNFVVLHEDTVVAETTEDENELVSADYDKDVYVFDNADATVQSLQEGEYFYIQPTEKDVIALSVKSVEVKGDQTIVTGNGGEIDEMFDFIKFESENTAGDVEVDPSAAEAGIVYDEAESQQNGMLAFDLQGLQDSLSGTTFGAPSRGMSYNRSSSKSLSFYKEFTNASESMKIKPSLNVGLKQEFNFYKKWSYVNIKYTLETPVSLSLTATVSTPKGEGIEHKLATIIIPTSIPGVTVDLEPKLVIDISGSFSVSYSVTPLNGFLYDSDTGASPIKKEGDDNQNFTAKVQGKIFAGIKFSAKISCLHIADCGLSIKAGLEVTGELSATKKLYGGVISSSGSVLCCTDTSNNTEHACDTCLTGAISFVASASVDLEILFFKTEVTIIELRRKLSNWYLSINNPALLDVIVGGQLPADWLSTSSRMKFGLGTCPNIAYKTTFEVSATNASGQSMSLPSARIEVDGVSRDLSGNKAVFHCTNGSHGYRLYVNNKSVKSDSFTTYNAVKTIDVPVIGSTDSNGNTSFVGGSGGGSFDGPLITTAATTTRVTTPTTTNTFVDPKFLIAETGSLGDNISYMLYGDGTMLVVGCGEMWNFSGSPFNHPENVKEVIFENEDTAGGKVITNIGNSVFKSCTNLTTIELPHSLVSIGNYAFYNCGKLNHIRYESTNSTATYALKMPNSLVTIGYRAFANCTGFKTVTIPAAVTTIDNNAFEGCTGFTSVKVPGTVQTLGSNVFDGCTALQTAVIADNVGKFGNYLFANCTNLQSLTLPYAGNKLADVNAEKSTAYLRYLFTGSVVAGTYSAGGYGVPDSLKTITITGGERIPNHAFDGLSSLTKLTLPSGILSIGNYALQGCAGLSSFTIPAKVTSLGEASFRNCSKLTGISIPAAVATIGANAFENCTAFTSVTVPGTVQNLGNYAFAGCTSLQTANIKDGVGQLGSYVFANCIAMHSLTLPYAGYKLANVNASNSYAYLRNLFTSSVTAGTYNAGSGLGVPNTLTSVTITGGTRVPNNAFMGMSSLTNIALPASITTIGNHAFDGCAGFTSFTIPNKVTSLGEYSFYNCAKLKTIAIPASVTNISSNAFNGCKAFTSVNVPGTVEKLGDYAFANCTALKTAYIRDGVGSLGSYLFSNCTVLESLTLPYAGYSLAGVNGSSSYNYLRHMFNSNVAAGTYNAGGNYGVPFTLTSITITGGERIPSYAFEGMSGLKSITVPNSITTIGSGALNGCSGLTSFQIPGGVTTIGSNAFNNCWSMTGINIPASVRTIGDSAFAGCTAFTSVTIPGTVQVLNNYTFNGCTALKNVVIQNGVGEIGHWIFSGCIQLESVTLPYAGHKLSSVNATGSYGYLRTLFNTSVVAETYNAGGGYGVPYTLTSITITGGTRIPANSFEGMSSLKQVTFPSAIQTIGNSAFATCSSLTDIYYTSTAINWMRIQIGTSGNDSLFNAEKHFELMAVTSSPESIVAAENAEIQFVVQAIGDDLKYQWQYSKDGGKTWLNSATTGDIYNTTATAARNGYCYRCIVTDGFGASKTSGVATLTVKSVLSISAQPQNVSAAKDAAVQFTVKASGENLTYQWQYSMDGGKTWNNSATTAATYTTTATTGRNGYGYRCIVTDGFGASLISTAATLTVAATKLSITTQPVSVTAALNTNVQFVVKATGENLSYQWQYSTDGGKTWKNSATTAATYTTTATTVRNGYQYRCIVTDGTGTSVTSSVASLTVKTALAITTQPVSVSAALNANVQFVVKATGSGLSYQWQYSKDGGNTWLNSATKAATYSTTATTERNGQKYRCVVTDASGAKVTSNVVTLTIKEAITITSQPASVSAYVDAGVRFTVKATGTNLKYQWQYSKDGGKTWSNSVTKTATYSTTATTARNGQKYRCVITDASGAKVTSAVATLTVYTKLTILSQPVSVSTVKDATVHFTVKALGSNVKYQWQYSKDGGKTWYNSATKIATYTTTATTARNGQKYRCILTDATGAKVTSNVVTLTIKEALAITSQPANVSAYLNAGVRFTVKATGTSLKYQWQYSKDGGKTWNNSATTTATYSTSATTARNGQKYRCIVTDASGAKVISAVATLTVYTKLTILSQPVSVNAAKDATVYFIVKALGSNVKYQWQYSKDGGKTLLNSTTKIATYTTTATTARNGQKYRCVLTDASGAKLTTNVVTLTLK